jgi:hypothetical protein
MAEPDDLPEEERARRLGRANARPVGLDAFPDKHLGLTGPPRVLALEGATRGQKAPAAQSKVKTVEINLVGNFKNPYGSAADEVKAMAGGSWSPSIDDFIAVAGNALTVNNYLELLGAILSDGKAIRAKGTVKRVNVFTHANPQLIALAGRIDITTTLPTVWLTTQDALEPQTLANLTATPPPVFFVTFTNGKQAPGSYTLNDVKDRFTGPDAELVFYACKSGVDATFLSSIASTLGVKVRGFKTLIAFCPRYQSTPPQVLDRKRLGLGVKGCANPVSDFHNLDNSPEAIVKP